MPADAATAKAEIGVLQEEYRALRSEANQRLDGRMTLVGFFAASAALVVGQHQGKSWPYWAIGIGLVIAGGLVWWNSGRFLKQLSIRLRDVEDGINDRLRLG